MMASQQSSITSTSTPKSTGPMPPPGSTTSTGRRISNANPTVPTPAPVLTDAVQKCVDTAAEAIATHREAKLVFMQGIVKTILREAYREPITPPSFGIPLAQSIFAGVPPPSRGPTPYFVTHLNYHNGQFYQYVRYHVPEFPHSSATFNIILGSHILTSPKVLQGSLGDSTCPMQCSQPCPVPANRHFTGLTQFPIVLNYIK